MSNVSARPVAKEGKIMSFEDFQKWSDERKSDPDFPNFRDWDIVHCYTNKIPIRKPQPSVFEQILIKLFRKN